jgi:hypothetical protein
MWSKIQNKIRDNTQMLSHIQLYSPVVSGITEIKKAGCCPAFLIYQKTAI